MFHVIGVLFLLALVAVGVVVFGPFILIAGAGCAVLMSLAAWFARWQELRAARHAARVQAEKVRAFRQALQG